MKIYLKQQFFQSFSLPTVSLFAFTFLILVFHNSLAGGQEIRADSSETLHLRTGVFRKYTGTVEAKFGMAQIQADSAYAWIKEEQYFFVPVAYQDSVWEINADKLKYDYKYNVASFLGRVIVKDRERKLTARTVSYKCQNNILKAQGTIRLDYPKQGIEMRAETLWYDALGDSGEAREQAQIVRVSESGLDSLHLYTEKLKFYNKGSNLWLSGQVRMWHAGIEATSQTAHFWGKDNHLELKGLPRANWKYKKQTTRDSVEIRADKILFIPENPNLRKILLFDHAKLHLDKQEVKFSKTYNVQADSVIIELFDSQMKELKARKEVRAFLNTLGGPSTNLWADQIHFFFSDGELDSLEARNRCGVTYVPSPKNGFVNNLSGRRITIRFNSKKIHHVSIFGEAIFEQIPLDSEKKEGVSLSGDQVEIGFLNGELLKTTVRGGVRGHYVPIINEEQR